MTCHRALQVVACTFEFTNVANEDYYILKGNTPLEGLYSPFVSVYHEGRRIKYQGIIAFRLPPKKQDFLLLKAGQSVSKTVQITDVFTFSSDGLYKIHYVKPLKFLTQYELELQDDRSYIEKVSHSQVSISRYIYLESTHLLKTPSVLPKNSSVFPSLQPQRIVTLDGCLCSITYIGGTRAEQDVVTNIHKNLAQGFEDANKRVGQNVETERWFGLYYPLRDCTVKHLFQDCANALRKSVVYDFINGFPVCNAAPIEAFTFTGSDDRHIYLCGDEFNNRSNERCSSFFYGKERILVHEWLHSIVDRDDICYYPINCYNLAVSEPHKAIANAENYALFYCKQPQP